MQSIDFQLDRNHVELNQLLKLAGVCDSGGAGKALVASGAVRVDGAVEMRKTCKIRAGQRVEVGEVRIEVAAGWRGGSLISWERLQPRAIRMAAGIQEDIAAEAAPPRSRSRARGRRLSYTCKCASSVLTPRDRKSDMQGK